MLRTIVEIEDLAAALLQSAGLDSAAAVDCAFLEAVGYPGLKLLAEALADPIREVRLEKDLLGLDLQNCSCVFIGVRVNAMIAEQGRMFLRNVRHGLYLLPGSVRGNYGIGCPVDPGFALGGERSKNPYVEKLEAATLHGVDIGDDDWRSLNG
jgi:hypothetical protein